MSGGAGGSGSGARPRRLTGPDPLGAEFDPERDDVRELRRRREKTVEALYGELKHQCAQSGRRFATRAELDAHLDVMHMRARRRKEGNASRRWCVDADQWVAGAAAEAADDAPAFFAAEEAAEEEREAAATASLPVDEDQPRVRALRGTLRDVLERGGGGVALQRRDETDASRGVRPGGSVRAVHGGTEG